MLHKRVTTDTRSNSENKIWHLRNSALLKAISSEIEGIEDEKKWAILELMLGTSGSIKALAKKMAKPETKTVTRTVAVPKTKIVK